MGSVLRDSTPTDGETDMSNAATLMKQIDELGQKIDRVRSEKGYMAPEASELCREHSRLCYQLQAATFDGEGRDGPHFDMGR